MVDMSAQAVRQRLREMARLLASHGVRSKTVDMSAAAVRARLQALGALSNMCRRLAALGDH